MSDMVIVRRGSLGMAVPTTTHYTDESTSAAPSANTDGVECKGFSQVLVGVNGFTTVADYTLQPYLYVDGVGWLRVTDADGAPVEFAALDGATPAVLVLGCGGADRVAVHISTVNPDGGATYEISLTLRPFGPGL